MKKSDFANKLSVPGSEKIIISIIPNLSHKIGNKYFLYYKI